MKDVIDLDDPSTDFVFTVTVMGKNRVVERDDLVRAIRLVATYDRREAINEVPLNPNLSLFALGKRVAGLLKTVGEGALPIHQQHELVDWLRNFDGQFAKRFTLEVGSRLREIAARADATPETKTAILDFLCVYPQLDREEPLP